MGLRKKKSLIDQASDYVDSVKPQIESAVTSAKQKALPLLADARDRAVVAGADARAKAGPLLADARDKAGPAIADARAKATPIIAEGAALAADKASLGASLAAEKAAIGRDLAAAKVAQLKGEPVQKKGGKLKKLLLVSGLAAIGGVVFSKVKGGKANDNWQSSYVPSPPPPAPAPAPVSDTADTAEDTGGSAPGEAISDSVEEPRPVSTPDEPIETVTIDEDAARKA